MKLPEFVGFAGTNNSGKDTGADVRFEKQGIRKVTLSDILRVEALKRGMVPDRESAALIGGELGRKYGAAILASMTIQNYYETKADFPTGLSIVSIRRVAEAETILDHDGIIIWVDADREERFRRAQDSNRGRVDDDVSWEEFCAKEDAEMYAKDDSPTTMNMSAVRDMATIYVTNDFPDEESYKKHLEVLFEL